MSLEVREGVADFSAFDTVNREAFPQEEFIATEEIACMHEEGRADVVSFYDEEEFVGFAVIVTNEDFAYLFFLAIAKEARSRGYGSWALTYLKKRYSTRQMVLDIEQVDSSAPNAAQRIARKRFYLRNGFTETGFLLRYEGCIFELLCSSESFDCEGFTDLLNRLSETEGLEISMIPR